MGREINTREEISEKFEEMGETVMLMDGFDEAFIGWSQRINEPILAVYSWDLMMKVCVERDGMTDEEADDYISYNCLGAWVGARLCVRAWLHLGPYTRPRAVRRHAPPSHRRTPSVAAQRGEGGGGVPRAQTPHRPHPWP